MAGLANNNNPFQSQVRIGPNYIQLVPGPPGPAGSIGSISGTGLVHVTSGSVDNAAYLGAAGGIPIVNSGGTDTAWLAIGTAGQVLTVVGGAPTWAAAPSGVTWANDLSTSSNTHQYVSAISGANGNGGAVTLGIGSSSFNKITAASSLQATPPNTLYEASTGFTGSNVGGPITFAGGLGGSGAAGNNTGGTGGSTTVRGGAGGSSTGTAANSNGGALLLQGGQGGFGGSGAAGVYGDITIGNSSTKAFATDNAAGPGFGIGTTPGTDPTITRGTGVPAATQTNGSLFLRTDGTSGSNALYAREGGAWYAIGGTTTTSATLTFEGQAFQLAAAGSGNGAILWPVGQATPTITQTILASDVTPANISITAQSAEPGAATHLTGGNLVFTSGTGATTNGTPGNVVLAIPAPTGSGVEGYVQMSRGGSVIWSMGYTAGQGRFWLGANAASPNQLNFAVSGDATNTYFSGPSNVYIGANSTTWNFGLSNTGVQLVANAVSTTFGGGSLVVGIGQVSTVPTSAPTSGGILWMNTGSPGSLGLFATGVQFHRLAGAITVSQDAPTSDVATNYMQIAAQTAFASASTNKNGGNLVLQTGTAASGGVNGDLYLQSGSNCFAFVASEAAGTGFGIGSTPGTDPTITRGSGVPGSTQPAGSLFLNTTAATVATALYARVGSSWVAIGGGGSFTAGGDLSGSSSSQEVIGILNKALPALSTGYLNYTGAAWTFTTPVTSIVAGTNITISGSTGAVTINSTAGGSVTWANDLSGSTSSNQWVNSISGHAGGGGTVSVGGSTNTNLVWLASQTAAGISQAAQTTDVVAQNFAITAQSAWTGASTNRVGANVVLTSGAGATTNGTPGSVNCTFGAPSGTGTEGYLTVVRNGVSLVRAGAQVGITGNGAIYLGNLTPSSSNYAIAGDGTANTNINGISALSMGVNGSFSNGYYQTSTGITLFNGQTAQLGGGTGVLSLANASVAPSSNPASGGVIFESAGALTHRGSGGATEQPAAAGTGTINTQRANHFRVCAFFRSTTSATQTIYTYTMPASAHTSLIETRVVLQDVTNISNSVASYTAAYFRMTGTTVTQLGTTTTIYNMGVGSIAVAYATGVSAVAINFTSISGSTEDLEAWIDIWEN